MSTLGPILPYNGTVPSGTDLFTTKFLRTIPDEQLHTLRGRIDQVLNDSFPQYTLKTSCPKRPAQHLRRRRTTNLVRFSRPRSWRSGAIVR